MHKKEKVFDLLQCAREEVQRVMESDAVPHPFTEEEQHNIAQMAYRAAVSWCTTKIDGNLIRWCMAMSLSDQQESKGIE